VTENLTLGQLIDARRGNRSYEALARDCGGTPGAKRLQQLAKKPVRNFPDPDSIRALALGLGASVTTVVMACARSLGLTVNTGDDPTSLVIGQAAQLPAAARDAIIAVAREMLKLQSVADKPTPLQQLKQAAPVDEPAAAVQFADSESQDDYDLARRLGQTDLGETLDAIDRAGETADPEGPEGGA